MFADDYCRESSPDLMKAFVSDPNDLETYKFYDSVGYTDDEYEDSVMSDETPDGLEYDTDTTNLDYEDEDPAINLNNDSQVGDESINKSNDSSSSLSNSQPVSTVQADHEVPDNDYILSPPNNSLILKTPQRKSSSTPSSNNNNKDVVIPDSSDSEINESNFGTRGGDKTPSPSKRKHLSSKKGHFSSGSKGSDSEDDDYPRTPVRSLRSKKFTTEIKQINNNNNSNINNNSNKFENNKDEKQTGNDEAKEEPESNRIVSDSDTDDSSDDSKPVGILSFKYFKDNAKSLVYDREVKDWLTKHRNDVKWKKNKPHLVGKPFLRYEQKCMIFYLIVSNTMSQSGCLATWEQMKKQYEYLPHRTKESLRHQSYRRLKKHLHQYGLPACAIKRLRGRMRAKRRSRN